MANYKVVHKSYGQGIVTKIKNGLATVKFPSRESTFALKDMNKYFEVYDAALQKLINDANSVAGTGTMASTPPITHGVTRSYFGMSARKEVTNSLLGPRSQTIEVGSEMQMFEIVGYLARPGRVSSIEAEVPVDGRDEVFEDMFPGQKYRPIQLGETPSGMPNKLSPQFRINIINVRNCPPILRANMGAGNAMCVARINKSKFVIDLVQNYGFQFGEYQDVSAIRHIAERKGYLEAFERGYSL